MTILLEHATTEKPRKPGFYWIKIVTSEIHRVHISDLSKWESFVAGCQSWYEEITLPDDVIIAQ